jgi:hypothetical protein
MTGRERIIERLKAARVKNDVLPAPVVSEDGTDLLQQLTTVLQGIGGAIIVTESLASVSVHLLNMFEPPGRWVSLIPELDIPGLSATDPHLLENVQ